MPGGSVALADADTAPPAALFRWRDLRKRALSAAILAPAAMACIWLGELPWTLLVAVAIALLTVEWVHLCGLRTRALPGAAVPVAIFLAAGAAVAGQHLGAVFALMAGFLLTWALGVALAGRMPVRMPAATLALGVLTIGFAGLSLIWLRDDGEAGRANVVFLFCVVWASDIGAYLAGRLIGGPKLAPALSPSKTWAGATGGLLAAIAAGLAAATAFAPGSPGTAAAMAALLGIATQIGDMAESALKRRFGVKDSGTLIPGHGGVLDRLDGLLAAAPVAAVVALVQGQGAALWR